MAEPTRKTSKTPNPFYVLLLVVSTAFVVTAFGYLIGPVVQQQAAEHPRAGGPGAGSRALAAWIERRGPLALGVEIALMVVAGTLAMTIDQRSSRRQVDRPGEGDGAGPQAG